MYTSDKTRGPRMTMCRSLTAMPVSLMKSQL